MTEFTINAIGLLCLILAALLMTFSEKTRSPVTFFICALGLAGFALCAWAALGGLLIVQCETYRQMCAAKADFEAIFGQMLRNQDKATTVFLSGGIAGMISMFFAVYVGIPRRLNIKLLVSIGCVLLVLGGGIQMYALFAS
jgi:hypothetical protein